MPRDLFGDVTRPSISIGNRKWYTVPVSLLSHSVIIAMFVVLPMMAAPYMPGVSGKIADYIPIIDPPKIPPAKPPKQPDLEPPPNHDAAPTVAPDGITKEPEVIRDPPATGDPGRETATDDLHLGQLRHARIVSEPRLGRCRANP